MYIPFADTGILAHPFLNEVSQYHAYVDSHRQGVIYILGCREGDMHIPY